MTAQLPYLTRLLVVIDQFEQTDVPVTWGRALARALHLPITLVHVVDPARADDGYQEAELIVGDQVRMVIQDVRFAGIDVTSEVIVGRSDEALPEVAEQHPGAILLLARHTGHNGVESPAIRGASFEAIIQKVRSPYLVLPDQSAPERIHSVVLGYDRSELSSNVLRVSQTIASSLDVDVIAVEALEPGSVPDDQFQAFNPVIMPELVQLRGRASRILLTVAQARDASLIAIGSHGAGESARSLMGRTAEWLIQHSDRPILIVPSATG